MLAAFFCVRCQACEIFHKFVLPLFLCVEYSTTSPTILMPTVTREYEAPDVAAKAAMQAESMEATTSDLVGEKMVLNMGPSHPATHGVLRLILEMDGEVITKAEPDVGFLHRGDEKIAENMHYNQFVPYTDRLDYLAPLANNVAYALAVEKLMGWEVPERGRAIRVICCELARISAHMLGVGVFAMDVGAMTVFLYTFTEREKIYNLCEQLTGARFTTSYTRVGGQVRDLPDGFAGAVRKFLDELEPVIDEVDKLLTRNAIFMARTQNLGVITKQEAIDWGITGPNLRGSGVEHDLRKAKPYLDYDRYDFDIPIGTTGDCFDRYLVRMEEMRQSVRILRQVFEKLPGGPINVTDQKGYLPKKEGVLMKMEELIHHFIIATQGIDAPAGEVYFGAENPKGELGFYIHSKGGGVPYRLKIRSPSFINLSILSKMLPGHLLSDVPSVLGSLDFVMGECDR
jgi:NADH-quinone oxidoreductase subunit D